MSRLRESLPRFILWGGILCAAVSLLLFRDALGDVLRAVEPWQWMVASGFVLGRLLALAAAWRALLRAFGSLIGWRSALAQTGMLLAGKYLPGKVFGVVARSLDGAATTSPRQAWTAGISEQGLGFVAAAWTGGVMWCAYQLARPGLLLLLPLGIPLVGFAIPAATRVFASLLALGPTWVGRFTPAPSPPGAWPSLLAASSLHIAQCLLVAAIVVIVLPGGGHLLPAVGLAGLYLLSMAGAMLVVVLPGGIGAREGVFVAAAAGMVGGGDALVAAVLVRLLLTAGDLLAGAAATAGRHS